jgi:hypothetical protein
MSRRHSALVHEAIVALAEHDYAAAVDLGGKHFKVNWLQNGRRRLLAISKSPSSRHAATSSRAALRRLLQKGAR